jgi:hypothetical protein
LLREIYWLLNSQKVEFWTRIVVFVSHWVAIIEIINGDTLMIKGQDLLSHGETLGAVQAMVRKWVPNKSYIPSLVFQNRKSKRNSTKPMG